MFNTAAPLFQEALEKMGISTNLDSTPQTINQKAKTEIKTQSYLVQPPIQN